MPDLRKHGKYYQAIYYDADGIRRFKSTRCTDARAAEAVARRLERTAHDPNAAAAENPTTLADALTALLAHLKELAHAGKRASATVDYHGDKSASLIYGFGGGSMRLAKLTATDVDAFISQRRADGASENTISKELVTLRQALKLAVRQGNWHKDPKAVLPVSFGSGYQPRERFLAPAEVPILLSRLTEDNAARLMFEVATSANLGEAERAMREDILFTGDTPTEVRIRGTKRVTRARVVPIVTQWQRDYLLYSLEHAQGEDGHLFKPASSYHNAIRRACATCHTCGKRIPRERVCPKGDGKQLCTGLEHICPNDLRRTFCHWMRQEGVPRELVAAAMGHSGTAMVDKVYGKLTADELGQLMRRAIGVPAVPGGTENCATGTPVTQTPPLSVDPLDLLDADTREKAGKINMLVGRPRFELGTNGLKVRSQVLPSPQKHRGKQKNRIPGGTYMTQQSAPGTALPSPIEFDTALTTPAAVPITEVGAPSAPEVGTSSPPPPTISIQVTRAPAAAVKSALAQVSPLPAGLPRESLSPSRSSSSAPATPPPPAAEVHTPAPDADIDRALAGLEATATTTTITTGPVLRVSQPTPDVRTRTRIGWHERPLNRGLSHVPATGRTPPPATGGGAPPVSVAREAQLRDLLAAIDDE